MDEMDLMTERWIEELREQTSREKVQQEYATMVRALVRTHPTSEHQDRTFPRIAALTDAVDDVLEAMWEKEQQQEATA